MTVLVVDASVLVAAASDDGPEGRWAEQLLESGQLAAPQLALAEATNILRRLERAGSLSAIEADAARRNLLALDLELFPFEPFADRIWELRHNLTTYDAWYVAVAEAIAAPLATLDRRLAAAPGPRCAIRAPV
ncbi:MAG: type II toxin-antitoxin system VapC family toxin [Burkholderiales bacterium]